MLQRIVIGISLGLSVFTQLGYGWGDEIHAQVAQLAIKLLTSTDPSACLNKNGSAIRAIVSRTHPLYVGKHLENESHYFYLDDFLGIVNQESLNRLPLEVDYKSAYPVYRNMVREQRASINRNAKTNLHKVKEGSISLSEVIARGLAVPRTLELYQKSMANFHEGNFKSGFYHYALMGHYLAELGSPNNVIGAKKASPEFEEIMEKVVRGNAQSPEFELMLIKTARKNGGWDLELPSSGSVPVVLFDLAFSTFRLGTSLTEQALVEKVAPINRESNLGKTAPIYERYIKDLAVLQIAKSAVTLARVWHRAYLDSIQGNSSAKKHWNTCAEMHFDELFIQEHYPDAAYLSGVQKMLGYSFPYPTRSISSQTR